MRWDWWDLDDDAIQELDATLAGLTELPGWQALCGYLAAEEERITRAGLDYTEIQEVARAGGRLDALMQLRLLPEVIHDRALAVQEARKERVRSLTERPDESWGSVSGA